MLTPVNVFRHYVPGQIITRLLGDLLLLAIVLSGGNWIWLLVLGLPPIWVGNPPLLPKAAIFALLGILMFSFAGLYDYTQRVSGKELLIRTMAAGPAWWIAYDVIAFFLPALQLSRFALSLGVGFGTLGIIGTRELYALHPSVSRVRERLLFLGATPLADRLISELDMGHPGYEILGYVDDRPPHQVDLTNGYRVLGTTRELQDVVTRTQAGTIVVALAERRGAFPMQAVMDCKLQGVRVEDWPAFYERLTGKIIVQNLRPSWLIFSEGFVRTRFTRLVKRWTDIALSASFLLLGMPIFLLVALAIKLDSRGPVFFRQDRVGERGHIFTLRKFRTMATDAEARTGPVWASEQDPRATRVGYWLRKTRLDEFPQVINVLKGEMSFIGPRPERACFVAELQEKIPYYSQRHTIKPGITGWAQVRYPYGATVKDAEEKLQYDLYYIKNLSFSLDMRILLSSIQVVLFGKGAR